MLTMKVSITQGLPSNYDGWHHTLAPERNRCQMCRIYSCPTCLTWATRLAPIGWEWPHGYKERCLKSVCVCACVRACVCVFLCINRHVGMLQLLKCFLLSVHGDVYLWPCTKSFMIAWWHIWTEMFNLLFYFQFLLVQLTQLWQQP